MAKVLLVDDEPEILRAFSRILRAAGHEIAPVMDPISAIAQLRTDRFDVIVSDISMPRMDGITFIREVRQQDLDVPVIVVTATPTVETAVAAVELGVLRYLTKPVELRVLEETVTKAALLYRLAILKREALEMSGTEGRTIGDLVALEVRFELALERLWIAFQPIVAWPDRIVHAYEALVRSDEPSLARPMDLFHAAERLGRSEQLCRAIRARVMEALPALPATADLYLNLHESELGADDFHDPSSPLARHAGRIVLEMTERVSLESIKNLATSIPNLRRLGYRIAVDDLGAGYAGLTSLAQLQPEVVKIDMSLIRGIHASLVKQRIVGAILELTEKLRMTTVCEGVEAAEERDTLQRFAGRLMQGYLFAKPGRNYPAPSW